MRILFVTALLLFGGSLFAQKKVKYKDIFPLLEQKRYDEAESDLRIYLSDEKNQDEGNPNLQMGFIQNRKFTQGYILSDTATFFAHADSAVYYFQQAIKYIDDKELRKNDEYYQSFYRRDLRTGEFGIKLSDVHLDIEKLIEEVELRKSRIEKVYIQMAELQIKDSAALALFNDFVVNHESYNDFLLASDMEELSQLGDLESLGNEAIDIAENIIKLADELGLDGLFMEISEEPITDFAALPVICLPKDGTLEIWKYSGWADQAKATIGGEVAELKRMLKEVDKSLEDSKQQLKKSILAPYPVVLPEVLVPLLEKYDADAAPATLLKARMIENTYLDITDTIHNVKLGDTAYVAYQVDMADSLVALTSQLQALTKDLPQQLSADQKYYLSYYTDQYGSTEKAVSYAENLYNWSEDRNNFWEEQLAYWDRKNSWGVLPNDTIPLTSDKKEQYTGPYQVWKTFADKNEQDVIAIGAQSDTVGVFVAQFGGDRVLSWKHLMQSKLWENAVNDTVSFVYDTLMSAEGDFAMYVYLEDSVAESNLLVASFSKQGKLNWTAETRVERKPVYDSYNADIRQHTIFLYPKEEYPLEGENLGYLVIDRNGEVR